MKTAHVAARSALSIDVAIVTFDAGGIDDVLAALRDLVKRDVIRVVELGLVERRSDGSIHPIDHVDGMGEFEAAAPLMAGAGLAVANRLDPGTTAMVIVWENIWATQLASALRDARSNLVETTSSVFETCNPA
jgi:hypothetical protein